MKLSVIGLLLLTSLTGWSQQTDIWNVMNSKFSDEPAVFVDRSEILNLEIVGDSLRAYSEVLEDVLYMKDQADMFSSKRVYGSYFSQIKDLKAKTLIWNKDKYKELQVSDFKKNSERSSGIFYDDSYYYSFNLPSLAARNRSKLQYREELRDPRFVSGYVFSSYIPQASVTYTVKASKDIEIFYEVVNDEQQLIKFKKTEKGNVITYEWTAKDLIAYKTEGDGPNVRYYTPHLICYVKSYQTKSGKKSVLNSLDDLHAWYRTFINELNEQPSAELTGIVRELKSASTSEEDLVKKVYYWVQDNIQYIAFEDGMRGFIPNSGSYTCEKRYGDCKDMANLIVNMLEIAGVKSYHTWVGTRDLPYRYSKVPTPLVDNHMIATYVSKSGEYYFLDGTSDYTTYGYPSSMIQGKEVLISLDENRYEVKEVPVIEKSKNRMYDSVSIRIDDKNVLVGKGAIQLNGFAKVFGGYELNRSEVEDEKRYVTKIASKGSNKFFLDGYKVTNVRNQDRPTRITYDFRLADYFQTISDELYINLQLNKHHYNNFINASVRKVPLENEYLYEQHEVVEFEIPKGYTVDYLPANTSHNGKWLGFDFSYTASGNKIILKKVVYCNYLVLEPNQFSDWNASVKLISEAYKESIILKKKA